MNRAHDDSLIYFKNIYKIEHFHTGIYIMLNHIYSNSIFKIVLSWPDTGFAYVTIIQLKSGRAADILFCSLHCLHSSISSVNPEEKKF